MERPPTTTELRYPGSGHVLRHVRLAFDSSIPGRTEGLMPALPDLCDDGNSIRLGAISLLADYTAGVAAMQWVSPDWPVTHDMALHLVQPAPPKGELEATCTLIRAGRNNVVSETTVVSPVVGSVARAFITFSRLSRRRDTPPEAGHTQVNLAENPDVERVRAPLDEVVGFRLKRGTGGSHIEFDHSPFVVNSLGAIQGGVVALTLERATSWAGQNTLGRPCRTTDLHLHYLALGKDGPFQTRAEVLRTSGHSAVFRISLVDTGNDDRLLALGVGTAEVLPG